MFKTVRRRFGGGVVPPAVLAFGLAAALACGPDRAAPANPPAAPPPPAATRADGVWIWSDADLARWRAARVGDARLRPGVWVSTLDWTPGGVAQRLARTPRVADAAGQVAPVAVVVRVEDTMHRAWLAVPDDSALAALLDARLAALLARVAAAGAPVAEVQLDYDCPVRRLARWAAVVARLRAGALRGREVWVTSLPAHLAEPGYGALFRPAASGHIVQLFDLGAGPGAEPGGAAVPRLAAALGRAGMPYRVGLGAFERAGPGGRRTRHRDWARALPALAASPWYRGAWVFPGGQPWGDFGTP